MLSQLNFYRQRSLLTKSRLAKLSGINRVTLRKLEEGKIRPQVKTAKKIADTFSKILKKEITPQDIFISFYGVNNVQKK